MEIAIIDDGINTSYFQLRTLKRDLEVDGGLNVRCRGDENAFALTHGTMCAAIIMRYLPDAEITSIKVLDEKTGRGFLPQLLAALEWCLANHVPFINLSIGSTQFKDFKSIRRVASALYRQGTIIVAAYHNRNIYTVPASLECVIGVRHNPALNPQTHRVNRKEFEYFAEANVLHRFTSPDCSEIDVPVSNSYAAPFITAMIGKMPEKRTKRCLGDIWEDLGAGKNIRFCSTPDIIDEAVVVDFAENENHDLFYFTVSAVYTRADFEKMKERQEFFYLVILAGSEDDLRALTVICGAAERFIRGIFYCFKKGACQLNGSLDSRAWYENDYVEKFTRPGAAAPDIPVVYIKGMKAKLIPVLAELEGMLAAEGYEAKIIGEFARAYLYGFEYSDSAVTRMNTIANVLARYRPDIIICGMEAELPAINEDDLHIALDEFPYASGGAALIYQTVMEVFTTT